MLTMTYRKTDCNPDMENSADMDHYRVTLRYGRKRMTLTYSKGRGHNGTPPTLAEVLDCMEMGHSLVENCPTFHDFCNELGYDEDSRRAERNYRNLQRQDARYSALGVPVEEIAALLPKDA